MRHELSDVRRELSDMRRAQEAADVVSLTSPTGKHYELFVESQIDEWLLRFCGVTPVAGSRRGLPPSDSAAGGVQWDARFSVVCDPSWVQPPPHSPAFLVYGGYAYERPVKLPTRHLSPTKAVEAEYFVVLEFTRFPGWHESWKSESGKKRKALLPRLEQRLAICVERAKAAGIHVADVCDVVAVVGVVAEDACREAVEAQLGAESCPHAHLRKMYARRRVVFFYCAAAVPVGATVLARTPDSAAPPPS